MLRCNACIRRTLTFVVDDAWTLQHRSTRTAPRSRTRLLTHRQLGSRNQYQSYATATSSAIQSEEYTDNRYARNPARSTPDPRQIEGKAFTPPWRTPNGLKIIKSTELDIPPSEVAVQREIRWLRDPLKLADRVAELLGEGNYSTALAIARASSKDLQCTVSWNHLVDFNMAQGKVKEAVKTYNEVRAVRRNIPRYYLCGWNDILGLSC